MEQLFTGNLRCNLSRLHLQFISLSENAKNAVCFRMLLAGLCAPQDSPTVIYQDNTAAIASSKNALSSSSLRHINVRRYIRELVSTQQVRPVQCSTTDQHADMCTKPLANPAHTHHTEITHGESFRNPIFPILPSASS
jgi:hypothetical protein